MQNASSNCLWVLERTHCTLGGRPLRRSGAAASFRQEKNVAGPQAPYLLIPQWPAGAAGATAADGIERIDRSGSMAGIGGGGTNHTAGANFRGGVNAGGVVANGGSEGGSDANASAAGVVVGAGVVAGVTAPPVDIYAQAAARQRRGMGAGEPVEHVRIKHLATGRYLCVGKDCDPYDVGTGDVGTHARGKRQQLAVAQQGPSMVLGHEGALTNRGEERDVAENNQKEDDQESIRVGMVTVGRYVPVPASTVFVLRPRPAAKSGPIAAAAAASEGGLGPEDLVHLQHKETGLFLSALPHRGTLGSGRVGLTVVKSPLTTEASVCVCMCMCV